MKFSSIKIIATARSNCKMMKENPKEPITVSTVNLVDELPKDVEKMRIKKHRAKKQNYGDG